MMFGVILSPLSNADSSRSVQIYTSLGVKESKCHLISNGNRTEWSTIQGEIGRVISNWPSMIAHELYDTKSYYQLIVSITKCMKLFVVSVKAGRSLAHCACRATRIVNFRQCFIFFTFNAFEINSAEQVVKF